MRSAVCVLAASPLFGCGGGDASRAIEVAPPALVVVLPATDQAAPDAWRAAYGFAVESLATREITTYVVHAGDEVRNGTVPGNVTRAAAAAGPTFTFVNRGLLMHFAGSPATSDSLLRAAVNYFFSEPEPGRDWKAVRAEAGGEDTVLLDPRAFSELPPAVRDSLARRGCMIPNPRPSFGGGAANVIVGTFARPGQLDWAVLCWQGQRSMILVFWGAVTTCPGELAAQRDSVPAPRTRAGSFWYSRGITPKVARRHAWAGEWPEPPFPPQEQLDHWGIEDHIIEKASSVWYCYQGRWWELPGAD